MGSVTQKDASTNETLDYEDIIQELRLKRLCHLLINMEQKCPDPTLVSEFVLAELTCGRILLQACANLYNCRIVLKGMQYEFLICQ